MGDKRKPAPAGHVAELGQQERVPFDPMIRQGRRSPSRTGATHEIDYDPRTLKKAEKRLAVVFACRYLTRRRGDEGRYRAPTTIQASWRARQPSTTARMTMKPVKAAQSTATSRGGDPEGPADRTASRIGR